MSIRFSLHPVAPLRHRLPRFQCRFDRASIAEALFTEQPAERQMGARRRSG
ncbi:hypothetical protein C7S15_0440 [Burkholderia cepacia]|nr:hypothetical protein [Burkholderia cepacia]